MRISGFSTTRPNMPTTRTYEDFMKFLGEFMTHNNKKIAPRINFVNCWKPSKILGNQQLSCVEIYRKFND